MGKVYHIPLTGRQSVLTLFFVGKNQNHKELVPRTGFIKHYPLSQCFQKREREGKVRQTHLCFADTDLRVLLELVNCSLFTVKICKHFCYLSTM